MKRTTRTKEQIVGILQEHEAGAKRRGLLPQAWHVGRHVLCLEGEAFRDDGVRGTPVLRHWSERPWRRG